MSILKIAKIGHPILLKKAIAIKNMPFQKMKDLVINMTETMLDSEGVGLAAPQVYVSKRVIVYRIPEQQDNSKEDHIQNKKIKVNVLINPSYVNLSSEFEDDWEGCLSIPGMLGKVRRYKKISYKGFDLRGKLINLKAEGMHARIIQHECDHLDGILYTSKLTNPKDFGFADEIKKILLNEKE